MAAFTWILAAPATITTTCRSEPRSWRSEPCTPGYFFRSGPAGEPRRTLIYNNGSDGPVTGAWVQGVADALDRGWNAVTFDGPGQNATLIRQHLTFRPDWENVITPVVDHLLTREDVDAGKIALLGVSQAGYWVTRSAAFEHRIAATLHQWGVVNRVLPAEGFDAAARQLAGTLAEGPTRAHAATKDLISAYLSGGVPQADAQTPGIAGGLFGTQDLQSAMHTFLTEGHGRAVFHGR
jgi:hypothetical protein